MIRHIVAFRLVAEDPDTRRRDAAEMRTRLEALVDVVPGVLAIEVHEDLGTRATNWSVILVSEFESSEALGAYLVHPRHQAVVSWMNDGIVSDRVAVDYNAR